MRGTKSCRPSPENPERKTRTPFHAGPSSMESTRPSARTRRPSYYTLSGVIISLQRGFVHFTWKPHGPQTASASIT